jgi:hypothetical protein
MMGSEIRVTAAPAQTTGKFIRNSGQNRRQ